MENTGKLIKELQSSNLIAECECGCEFHLSDAILFDGLGRIPAQADEIRKELLLELKERESLLKKSKISAGKGAEIKAMDVGIGKIMEKVLPSCIDFPFAVTDCRPMFEPIDMLAFRGMSAGHLESIVFMEIKTGQARLNAHQKAVKDIVEDKKVSYKGI